MKLTKKQEQEARKVYAKYWDSYTKGDLKGFSSTLDEAFEMIGTSENEVCHNKTDGIKFYKAQMKEMAGKVEMRNRRMSVKPVNGMFLFNETADIYILDKRKWTFYARIRLSTLLHEAKSGWKVIQQHGSFPDMRVQEGETIAFEKISKENLELKDAVKRATVELETKNRNLKTEAALERVRTVAMGMKKSGDLLSVCKTGFRELKKLGFADLRNMIIHTYVDEQKYFNDYDYSDALGGATAKVPYTGNPVIEKFIRTIRKGKSAFSEIKVTEKQLEDWKKFRKANKEPVDPRLDKAKALYYYIYSVGSGSIGISTFSPIDEEKRSILIRFRNVFDLSYQRYLDIQKAEAQAREAQIQLALERVRARGMSMQASEELGALIGTLFTELTKLDLVLTRCVTWIIDPKTNDAVWWMANSEDPSHPMSYLIPYHQQPPWLAFMREWKKRTVKWVYDLKGKTKKDWDDHLFSKTGLAKMPGFIQKGMRAPDRVLLSVSFNNFGGINVASLEPLSDEHFNILLRFAKVFDQTYTRFLDLKNAEAQAREAQIQLALERVRARTMAMHRSDELTDVVKLLYQEFDKLRLSNESTDIEIGLIDEETGVASIWAHFYLSDGSITTFNMPIADFKGTIDEYKIWKATAPEKRSELFFTSDFSGRHWKRIIDWVKKTPELAEIFQPLLDARITRWVTHNAYFSHGLLTLQGTEPYSPETLEIQKRFTKVFEQTYTRFLDLQKAEAQAREAQIEAALERVRSRSLAMHSSGELGDIVTVVLNNLMELGYIIEQGSAAHLVIFSESTKDFVQWSADPALPHPVRSFIPYTDLPILSEFWDARQKGHDFFARVYSFDEKNTWFNFAFEHSDLKHIPEELKKLLLESETYAHSIAIEKNSAIIINSITGNQLSENQIDILRRFSKVFEQAYVRFLDLQKAEAQAREAQIEAALERVRSRSMAMHKSEELSDLSLELVKQVQALGVATWFCAFNIYDDDPQGSLEWGSNGQGVFPRYRTPREGVFLRYYEAGQRGETLLINEIGEDECPAHYEYLCSLPGVGDQLLAMKKAGIPFPSYQIDHVAFFRYGYILFITYEPVPETHDIFKRFARVFEQTYTRFLDLKKAEAQAKEAQIEAALEKVRSRSLAMHKSDEIEDVLHTVFEKLKELGIDFYTAIIILFTKDSKDIVWWLESKAKHLYPKMLVPYADIEYMRNLFEAREKGIELFSKCYLNEEKMELFRHLFEHTGFANVPEEQKKFLWESEFATISVALANNTAIHITSYSRKFFSDQDNDVLKRFAKVFEQAYTRFLDLQRAEVQAREAQIEASLERVRSRTMAMQKSDELLEAGELLCSEMNRLGITSLTSGYVLMDADERIGWNYTPNPGSGKIMPAAVGISHVETAEMQRVLECWKNKDPFSIIEMGEEQTIRHQTFIAERSINFPLSAKELLAISPKKLVMHNFNFKEGYILIVGGEKLTNDQIEIMLRFTNVFQQTYTRFLDLQRAEAQAREAQIEAALEKVRSRSLAMQQPNELTEVAELLRKEMGQLGVEELETSSIYIVDKENLQAECWYAIKDIREESKNLVSDEMTITFADTWVGSEMGRFYRGKKEHISIVMRGDNRKEWIDYCAGKSKVLQGYYGDAVPERTYHLVKFNGGYMGAASQGDISAESWDLLRRAASVFSLAYTRFNDLKIAEAHALQAEKDLIAIKEAKQKAEQALGELQATQKQLIQSEKMASLGELTAGIAHEIQNPLNFVNNFSEVSKELLDEMKEELESGNVEDAKEIMQDVIQNLEKINYHGKRADGIVKGMLQHSRSSSGQKEPTDINALCDEYLRLAFHGLRAKDKSFNAKFEIHFDETVGKIDVMPQDMGRVVLNLINNAFYAVSERKKTGEAGYEPAVIVSTKKENGNVIISVRDNGTGIPQKVLDKIFQPFFTTKPTGQGTGLGLSLAYDIVKAHGGELKVGTKEGEGTTFIINLPLQ